MILFRSGREVRTVFDLLGDKENDMTFSLGWVLANSELFLAALIKDLTGRRVSNVADCVVRLQAGRDEHGITDVEVALDSEIAIILEAKRGSEIPSARQLQKYAAALKTTQAKEKLLVTISNATAAYAKSVLSRTEVRGARLLHRSWRQVKDIAACVVFHDTNANKRWLNSFIEYLEGLLQMETRFSNWTYVVALAKGNPKGWEISWIDIVEKSKRYFYPVGGGWADPPPNYIAFRYGGRLQSIHHVEGYDLVSDPGTVFPEAAKEDRWDPPLYCLRLGPPTRPATEVRNGPRVNRAARVWCMIDTLLTSRTISDALTETERRTK